MDTFKPAWCLDQCSLALDYSDTQDAKDFLVTYNAYRDKNGAEPTMPDGMKGDEYAWRLQVRCTEMIRANRPLRSK